MFKFFTQEEIAEALTIIVNAKSPNLKVELHNVKGWDARTLWFWCWEEVVTLMIDETPLGEEHHTYSYDFTLAEVKGHELEVAEEIEYLEFNILVEDEDLMDEDEGGPTCEITKGDNIITVETFGTSPICDEDIELVSEQYHAQMPEKIKVKTIECVPYPSKDNTITLDKARKITMKELLLMVKKILSDAEGNGTLSEYHELGDLVLEQIVIEDNGTIVVFVGS